MGQRQGIRTHVFKFPARHPPRIPSLSPPQTWPDVAIKKAMRAHALSSEDDPESIIVNSTCDPLASERIEPSDHTCESKMPPCCRNDARNASRSTAASLET